MGIKSHGYDDDDDDDAHDGKRRCRLTITPVPHSNAHVTVEQRGCRATSNLNDDFLLLGELAFRGRKRDARINLRYALAASLLQLHRVFLESRHDR